MTKIAQRTAAGVLLAYTAVLGGCGSELEKLSDSELQDRAYQCSLSTEQTPGGAISCENYRRECLRRRDEGRYVC